MKKKIPLIILAIIIITSIIAIYLYCCTDLFKTPQEQFWSSLSKASKITGDKTYSEALNEIRNLKEKSYTLKGDAKFNISSTEEDEEVQKIADAFSKIQISYDMNVVGKENKEKGILNFDFDNKQVLSVDYLRDNDLFGIKIGEVYDKYISIENKNLKQLAEKYEIDSTEIPDKIEFIDMHDLYDVSEEEIQHINDLIVGTLKNEIPEECYSVNENVETDILGEKAKTKEYKIELSAKQIDDIAIKLLENAKRDEVILNLIVNKYNKISMNTIAGKEKIAKDDLIKEIEESIKEIQEEPSKEGVIVSNFYAKDKAKIDISTSKNNIMNIELQKAGKETVINIGIYFDDETASDTKTEKMRINGKVKINQTSNEKSNANIETQIETEDLKFGMNMNYEIEFSEKIPIESFTAENSINLNNITTEEFEKEMEEIYYRAIFILPQKMKLLGIDMSSLI
ncbi:MAG: DUF6583 family protein [Clostridia bacterium]